MSVICFGIVSNYQYEFCKYKDKSDGGELIVNGSKLGIFSAIFCSLRRRWLLRQKSYVIPFSAVYRPLSPTSISQAQCHCCLNLLLLTIRISQNPMVTYSKINVGVIQQID